MSTDRDSLEGLPNVTMHVDGSCLGNPGPGGYAAALTYGTHRRELCKGFKITTNNRMELMAAIAGLEALKRRCKVTVWTDSQYLANGIEHGWALGWRANRWKKKTGEAVANSDLWARLLDLCDQHAVEFVWIKGHSGSLENDRCDKLARLAAETEANEVDVGYHPYRTAAA